MNLVIVESPTKSRTISKFLGKTFKVMSSFGHIRDLPKSELGVDVAHDFEPKYVIPMKSRKVIKELKEESKKADSVILATDEDREGEAIAWHLAQALGLNVSYQPSAISHQPKGDDNKKRKAESGKQKAAIARIVFHEITKQAIEEALKNPRSIDMNLVDAQQARRILDRLVGYKLSPFLWKKIMRGLSAGRVQSVAVRLIAEREREIEDFKSEEYWEIAAELQQKNPNDKIQNPNQAQSSKSKNSFLAKLHKINGESIPKLGIKTKEETDKILKDLEEAEYQVENIEKKEVKRNPLPPFTTSTLQQEAWKKLHLPAKRTMSLAQNLYEKGLITYHRTDSFNLSDQALFSAKKFISENYGENYWAGYPRKFKTKSKGAQEAHEAIRPTSSNKTAETLKKGLDESQFRLYDLIWRRFIACQMQQASFDSTTIDIKAKNYNFRATGSIMKFDGFLKVYPIKFEENELPDIEKDEILELIKLLSSQHFTQPPPRYNDASLIKTLEEYGIGRPSTYAPIIDTIQQRNYVERDESKRFKATEIGFLVNDLLVEHFPKIVEIKFTAEMEENLDKIAEGEKKLVPVLEEFYNPFEKNLKQKYEDVSKRELTEKTDKKCPDCGEDLIIRFGKFGKFLACSNFPKCKHTENLQEAKNQLPEIKCPKCGMRKAQPSSAKAGSGYANAPMRMQGGEIVEKRTRKGKIFYGCNQYPKCDFALWEKPLNEKCPNCDSLLMETKKKIVKCSNRDCDYKKPTA